MSEVIKIKVNNWVKHQPKRKDVTHPSWFKLSNRILEDPKVLSLSAEELRVFVYLLCRCSLEICEEVELVQEHLRLLCKIRQNKLNNCIVRLEQLHMVTVLSRDVCGPPSIDKIDKIREYNTDKRREDKSMQQPTDAAREGPARVETTRREPRKNSDPKESKSGALWQAYLEEYQAVHNKPPAPRNAKVNSQLCNLVNWFGSEESVNVVRYYFKLPNNFYVRNFHPIGVLVKDAHAIYGSMTTGKVITATQGRQMERSLETKLQLERIDRGEV